MHGKVITILSQFGQNKFLLKSLTELVVWLIARFEHKTFHSLVTVRGFEIYCVRTRVCIYGMVWYGISPIVPIQ